MKDPAIEEVWVSMPRDSERPNTETAALRLYLDESGGEDPGTPHSVLGGMLIFQPAFQLFESAWEKMLLAHEISDGLHMKEFGRPNGKYAQISDRCRHELFTEACHLIQRYRAVTMANTLSNEEYRAYVPEAARRRYSVYAMGYSLMVMMNHKLAEHNNYPDPIPIIMDSGNAKAGQIQNVHGFMQKRFQKIAYLHLGNLTFDDDRARGVLQAADLIAWGTRRRASRIPFGASFSPVNELLSSDESHHAEIPWKQNWLRDFGASLDKMIANGEGRKEPTDEEIGEGLVS